MAYTAYLECPSCACPRARSTNAVACHNLLSLLKFHCVYAKWLDVVKSGKLLILR